jgi:diguanylate cyclase (GGDEF)-like protein
MYLGDMMIYLEGGVTIKEKNIYYKEELYYSYRRVLSYGGFLLLTLFLYFYYKNTPYYTYFMESMIWMIVIGISSIIHYYFVRKYPDTFPVVRKLIPSFIDLSFLTYLILLFDEYSVFLLTFYILITMRVGLSFGKNYFYFSFLFASVSWITIYYFSPYWQIHDSFLATFAASTFLAAFLYLDYLTKLRNRHQELHYILEDIRYEANLDPLTGVYNRKTCNEICNRLIAENVPFAMLYIDLNDFKRINDVHGHHIGDMVLKELTKKLRLLLCEYDTLARLGGDEFVILLSRRHHSVKEFLQALQHHALGIYKIGGIRLNIKLSIGVSLYPENGQDMHTLSEHADMAMYQAKRNPDIYYCFYDEISSCKENRINSGR